MQVMFHCLVLFAPTCPEMTSTSCCCNFVKKIVMMVIYACIIPYGFNIFIAEMYRKETQFHVCV